MRLVLGPLSTKCSAQFHPWKANRDWKGRRNSINQRPRAIKWWRAFLVMNFVYFCTPKGALQKAFLSLKGSKMMLLQKAFLFVARSHVKPLHFVGAVSGLWTWFCSSKMGAPRIVAIKRLHRCTPAMWTRMLESCTRGVLASGVLLIFCRLRLEICKIVVKTKTRWTTRTKCKNKVAKKATAGENESTSFEKKTGRTEGAEAW